MTFEDFFQSAPQIVVMLLLTLLLFLFVNDRIFFRELPTREKWGKLLKLALFSPATAIVLAVPATVLCFLPFLITHAARGEFENGFMERINELNRGQQYTLLLWACFMLTSLLLLLILTRYYAKALNQKYGVCVFIGVMIFSTYCFATLLRLCWGLGLPLVMLCIVVPFAWFYRTYRDRLRTMVVIMNDRDYITLNLMPVMSLMLMMFIIVLLQYFRGLYDGFIPKGLSIFSSVLAVFTYALSEASYNVIFRHINDTDNTIKLSRRLIVTQEQVILAFAEITEAKSAQTGQHIKRVSEYCRVLAQAMLLSPDEVENIRVASMMHDVGKLMIPPEVLEKEGRLTEEEFEIMKSHVTIGENLLHNAPGSIMQYARTIALEHHERWDGNGYIGKKGFEINKFSRIVTVADVFDALVTCRSYKDAWEPRRAYELIVSERGKHFDPQVVDAFSANFEKILEVLDKYTDELVYAQADKAAS